MEREKPTKIYKRDKRSPTPTNETVSYIMSKIKPKDTQPELTVRRLLWSLRLRGYRVHNKDLPGKPDISFTKYKLAIFIHGCYWHRCPICNLPLPKSNIEYWKNKFNKNISRDKRNYKKLDDLGWKVIVIWECETKNKKLLFKKINLIISELKVRGKTIPHIIESDL